VGEQSFKLLQFLLTAFKNANETSSLGQEATNLGGEKALETAPLNSLVTCRDI
jgi:hypothetical protein